MNRELEQRIIAQYPDWLASAFAQIMKQYRNSLGGFASSSAHELRLAQKQTHWVQLWLRYLMVVQASGFWLARQPLEDWESFPACCQPGSSLNALKEGLEQLCTLEPKGPLPFQQMHHWFCQQYSHWQHLLDLLESSQNQADIKRLSEIIEALEPLLSSAQFMLELELYGVISENSAEVLGVRYRGEAVEGILSGSIPVKAGGLYLEEPRTSIRFQLPFFQLCPQCLASKHYKPLTWESRSARHGMRFSGCQHGPLSLAEALDQSEGTALAFDRFAEPNPARLPSKPQLHENSLGMRFVLLPAGQFLMGSPSSEAGRRLDEVLHQVSLSRPFYLMTTPVTQAQWQAVMGNNPAYFQDPQRPVESISWLEIQEFLKRLNAHQGAKYRLPSEAEWEYACRAGSKSAFCFGDHESQLAEYGWFEDNSQQGYELKQTHPVALLSANAWGLYDMHGNIWEWVMDGYEAHHISAATDPTGSFDSDTKVIKGGRWNSPASSCRSASRSQLEPDQNQPGSLGFRLALNL